MGYLLAVLLALIVLLIITAWLLTFHPQTPVQEQAVVCTQDAPLLHPGQPLKVLSWNLQFMAGKEYVFFYDQLDGNGPDTRPSPAHITSTFAAAARLINAQDPDILLLQELDEGARRTDYQDQSARLLALLDKPYPCRAETYYWKSAFVPHPKIMGAVGLKLVTFSKYHIDHARRHALPQAPDNPLYMLFNLKRALLECRLPLTTGGALTLLNTHLEAFGQGTDIMERQVQLTTAFLDRLQAQHLPWLIGGDFNLLPPGVDRNELHPDGAGLYHDPSEIHPFFDKFHSVIPLDTLTGPQRPRYFTHHPNNPQVTAPERTIDYIFYDGLSLQQATVLQQEGTGISDHFPIVAQFKLPE